MQDEIANLVHPVISYGLDLRECLEMGESFDIDREQAILKGMLRTNLEAQRWPEYGGDPTSAAAFLGIRYALVCWLDELFICYSRWERSWAERRLEAALYGSNDRAWKFWEQAGKAEQRAGVDGLEVFFLCVMLGFRGDKIGTQDKLEEWVGAARARLPRNHVGDWQRPPELELATAVPPLRAREQMQRMVLASSVTLLLIIPVVVFLVVRQVGP